MSATSSDASSEDSESDEESVMSKASKQITGKLENGMTALMLIGLFTLRSDVSVVPMQSLARGLVADPENHELHAVNASVSYRKIAQMPKNVEKLITGYRNSLNTISSGVTEREQIIKKELAKELKELKTSAEAHESIREFRRMVSCELADLTEFEGQFEFKAQELELDKDGRLALCSMTFNEALRKEISLPAALRSDEVGRLIDAAIKKGMPNKMKWFPEYKEEEWMKTQKLVRESKADNSPISSSMRIPKIRTFPSSPSSTRSNRRKKSRPGPTERTWEKLKKLVRSDYKQDCRKSSKLCVWNLRNGLIRNNKGEMAGPCGNRVLKDSRGRTYGCESEDRKQQWDHKCLCGSSHAMRGCSKVLESRNRPKK